MVMFKRRRLLPTTIYHYDDDTTETYTKDWLETGDVYEWRDEARQTHYGVRYEWLK